MKIRCLLLIGSVLPNIIWGSLDSIHHELVQKTNEVRIEAGSMDVGCNQFWFCMGQMSGLFLAIEMVEEELYYGE